MTLANAAQSRLDGAMHNTHSWYVNMRHSNDLASFDLNLLRSLRALLSTCSVTLAAAQTGVTQPAMSRSLGKLREALGDPLLVRTGRGFVRTPRGEELNDRVEQVLSDVQRLLSEPGSFDAATSDRVFRLTAADMFTVVTLPTVLARLERVAPGVNVEVVPSTRPEADLESGWLDAAVAPSGALKGPELMRTRLFDETFVVLMRAGHPALEGEWNVERYASLHHALVAPGGRPGGLVDRELEARGLRRRVVALVPSFAAVPVLVAESELVTALPSRMAAGFARQFGLQARPLPLDGLQFGLDLYWHHRFDADAGHRWWRGVVKECAR